MVLRAQVRLLLVDAWARRSSMTIADALYVVLAELRPAQEVRATVTQCSGERFEVMHVAGQDRF